MHYVIERWLGGTLTNFREIRKRVGRLDHLEQLDNDGLLDQYSKKEGSSLRREKKKIMSNLGGIRKMDRMPGAIIVIDQHREINCVREANKMHIPVVCLLDTDCDPDLIDIQIPGNDDAMRAIEIVVKELCDAVDEGIKGRVERDESAQAGEAPRRRSRRPTMGRASEETAAASAEVQAPAEAPTEQTTEPGVEEQK